MILIMLSRVGVTTDDRHYELSHRSCLLARRTATVGLPIRARFRCGSTTGGCAVVFDWHVALMWGRDHRLEKGVRVGGGGSTSLGGQRRNEYRWRRRDVGLQMRTTLET